MIWLFTATMLAEAITLPTLVWWLSRNERAGLDTSRGDE